MRQTNIERHPIRRSGKAMGRASSSTCRCGALLTFVLAMTIVGAGLFLQPAAARADVSVHIDKSEQRMTVSVDGFPTYNWAISSGRRGYNTPVGTYRPQRLARRWYSSKYDNSPMPYSVFFYKGYAIHGTNYVSRLGRPASHGCIRLHPQNAARLFSLIQEHGKANTRIQVTN